LQTLRSEGNRFPGSGMLVLRSGAFGATGRHTQQLSFVPALSDSTGVEAKTSRLASKSSAFTPTQQLQTVTQQAARVTAARAERPVGEHEARTSTAHESTPAKAIKASQSVLGRESRSAINNVSSSTPAAILPRVRFSGNRDDTERSSLVARIH